MKINKTRRKSNGTISRRKYKKIHKSRKQLKRTHKKSLLRLKKYNKNNRYRRHYTRRVNRSKRGGVPLPQISKPFNFAFPDHIQNIKFVAAGWGYVTKLNSVFSQKNRPEQLIVYKNNTDNKTYIARCTFENCEIKKGTLTETNMEESIQVENITVTSETDGSLLANVRSFDKKVYTIKPSNNNSAEIIIKEISIPNLFEYFSTLTKTACINFLQNFRTNPHLLGVLVDSIALSKTVGDDKNICFKIISENIFPMTDTDTSNQINIEKQFANMLYNLCSTTIKKMGIIKKETFGNELFRSDDLFTKLLTHYSSIRGKKFLSDILAHTNLSKLPSYDNDREMLTFALIILVSILEHISDLPIGYKCVSSSIYDELDRKKVDQADIKSHIFNFLCLKLICPFIGDYFMANNMNELAIRIPKLIQNIANNDLITNGIYGKITFDHINNTSVTSLASFHEYANKQLSIDTLNCDLTGTDAISLEKYTYNLEKSPLNLTDFEKFKELTTPKTTTMIT